MFTLHDLPPQIDPALIALLESAEPATILYQVPRIAGTAVTVRFAGVDGTLMHYALGQLRPGDVLIVDRCGDTRHAAVGGGVAFAARAAGAKGIVMDGMATDIGEIRDYAFPVWARGLSPVTTKRQFHHGEFCVPVTIGGVVVAPGDAVLADENGVLVLKPDQVKDAAERAIAMQKAEGPRLAEVAKGHRLPELNGTNAKIREIMAAQKPSASSI